MNLTETVTKPPQRIPAWIWLHSSLFLSAMKMDFNFDLVSLAVPLLAISFGASSLQLGFLGALQRFFYILVCPVSGRLSDHWGRKGLAISGAILFGATCLALTQVQNVTSIAWVIPWIGVTLGLFWPALQGWLSDQGESQLLRQSTSLFNLFWSIGSMLGMVLAGVLMRFSGQLPFYVAAGVATSIALILAGSSHKKYRAVSSSPSGDSGPLRESSWDRAQRQAALTSIFMVFLVIGGVTTQFPKLATQLGYSTALIGLTMGFLPLSRTLGFLLFDRSKASPDISSVLILVKLLLAAAMAVLVVARATVWFMLAFALLGLVYAAIFSFSQYLCLKNPAHAGRRIGYHESSMLGGIVVGSILSGLLAQNLGFRFTFAFGILLSVLTLAAQPGLFHGYAQRTQESG
jgi:MFS transporter, DHA1 family, multidrug resistance protein